MFSNVVMVSKKAAVFKVRERGSFPSTSLVEKY